MVRKKCHSCFAVHSLQLWNSLLGVMPLGFVLEPREGSKMPKACIIAQIFPSSRRGGKEGVGDPTGSICSRGVTVYCHFPPCHRNITKPNGFQYCGSTKQGRQKLAQASIRELCGVFQTKPIPKHSPLLRLFFFSLLFFRSLHTISTISENIGKNARD